MSADRNTSSNSFEPNTMIHQGDTVHHNHSSNALRRPRYVIPFPENEDVIRRHDIIKQLDPLLSSKEGEYCDAALWGLGGSGKTQIALDYAYRRYCDGPACSVFWVHADNEGSFAQDYQTIARKLGLDHELNGEMLFLAVRDCIESLQQWLLVVDNADDVTRFGVGVTDHTKSLLKYIPRGPGGTVLWTSRNERIVALTGPKRGVRVTSMEWEEAMELLQLTINKAVLFPEMDDARLLLRELEWLPLAISQAGSYMRKTSTPIKAYVSRLLEGKNRWDMLKEDQYDRNRRPGMPNSILETWNISIQHIRQESEVAYGVLQTIAYIDNQNIPLSIILAALTNFNHQEQETSFQREDEVVETAVTLLKEFSFIHEHKTEISADRSFEMPKLVQEAIRYKLNTEDAISETYFSSTALSIIESLFPHEVKPETWFQCEKYATHAMRVSDWAEMSEDVTKTIQFLGRVTNFFMDNKFFAKAEYMMKKELSLTKTAFGEEHPMMLPHMSRLTEICNDQGRYKEAKKYALEMMELAEKTLGRQHDITIRTNGCLADICLHQGRIEEAEKYQKKEFALLQEFNGEEDIDTIEAMSHLAEIYDQQKRYDEAKELKVEALAWYSEILGEEHLATVDAMEGLAETYKLAGRRNKAKKLETKVLLEREKVRSEEFPRIDGLERLAKTYQLQGQLSKAKDIRMKILQQRKEELGEKHIGTILAIQAAAEAHILDREWEKAKNLLKEALELLRKNFGDKNDSAIRILGNLAQSFYMQKYIHIGKSIEEEIISLGREIYGEESPAWLHDLFELLSESRRYGMSLSNTIRLFISQWKRR